MIKNLWKNFLSWLFSWQKEEKDTHLELYEDVPEPDIKIEDVKCTTHYPRYKKSCTVCRSAEVK